MTFPPLREIKPFVAPGAILLLAMALVFAGRQLPASIAGLGLYGPYALCLTGIVISLWFNRGRAFLTLLSLLLAIMAYQLGLAAGTHTFAWRAALTAIAVFVPLNILVLVMLPERGIHYFRNYRWLLLVVVEVLFTTWVASSGKTSLSGTAWRELLDIWLFKADPTPLLGRLLMAAGFVVALVQLWARRNPLDIGMAGALVAFFIACQWPASPGVFSAFVSAAAAILLLAVLQESHRMAFIDELTGLPGRRALEERLVALGPVYTIAMVDVDHFKKFNDTHGHDVGDHVLRMVGARLAEVEGGGKPFRYGGEEFSVLFPDRTVAEALPHLEALRLSIENCRIANRTEERRKGSRAANDRRSNVVQKRNAETGQDVHAFRKPEQLLSVTVSIGVAGRNDMLNMPEKVIKAADEALYRAKEGGRNQVSK
ncbi:MAG TPA: GGDEF domain-containing protein [Burkholderiales bacterium]|jgi:diguanylate cyclase (GGDEF)-like protein|nr:GGDEF domain-containing protein [Burkholderiales bacterium]